MFNNRIKTGVIVCLLLLITSKYLPKQFGNIYKPCLMQVMMDYDNPSNVEIFEPEINNPTNDTNQTNIYVPQVNGDTINQPEVNQPEINNPELNKPVISSPNIEEPQLLAPSF